MRDLDTTIDAGVARLLELQHPDGWWVGELESNASMVAEHLFWLHYLGLRDPDTDRKLANELLARRRDDGTWSNWWEGPADLSTTIESYVALKMAGADAGDETRAYITHEGGVARCRVFTKCFLALLGQWPWQDIPTVPVEIVLLPPAAPLSIYNFSCWARQTIVPLSVVQALRPARPAGIDLAEIGARPGSERPRRPTPIRRRALAAAERWVRERQEADGGWGGIQPPWVWSIIMLASLG
jgi:squalene-hopene/tetraprenyl-beta-curcumene cyclase